MSTKGMHEVKVSALLHFVVKIWLTVSLKQSHFYSCTGLKNPQYEYSANILN